MTRFGITPPVAGGNDLATAADPVTAPSTVPGPASLGLVATALFAGLAFFRRR